MIQIHARDNFQDLHTAIWSGCVSQLKSEQTPFHGQVVEVDLLLSVLCKRFDWKYADFFNCIFLLRDLIELSNDRYSGL